MNYQAQKNANKLSSLLLYLEYGIRWPITGGELYYVGLQSPPPFKIFVPPLTILST
jgi:hypothetical protein